MTRLSLFFISTLLSLSLMNTVYAAPETDWPKKPIIAVLSFPAGGSTDVFARALTAPLSEALGQSVVVENKPGGAGNIAMQEVANATDELLPSEFILLIENNTASLTEYAS